MNFSFQAVAATDQRTVGIIINQGVKRQVFHLLRLWLLLSLALLVSSCAGSLNLKNLAKGDIDLVADAHIRQVNTLLRELTVKLYKRNPNQLTKTGLYTLEARVAQIFEGSPDRRHVELQHKHSLEAIRLAFDEAFQGDRVFALMVGMRGMIHQSYNGKTELFMLDTLDQQKLYNSARNMEIVAWRLSNRTLSNDQLMLLTNSMATDVNNLSFERLFGKVIALQDMMAQIIAQRNQRTINVIVQKIASSILLPV